MSDINRQAADLSKAFLSKAKDIDTSLARALEMCGILVEGDAVDLAPRKTGLLIKTINHRLVSKNEEQVGTNVEYAAFQEFGTSKMKPQPFLTPALNRNKQAINSILIRELKKDF